MNPAALKANIKSLKKGGTVIANMDAFTDSNFKKCGYESNPLKTHDMEEYKVVEAHITSQTLEALKDCEVDNRSKARCKNFYALGITYFMFGRDLEPTIKWIEEKFQKRPELVEANIMALKAGRNYAETIETVISNFEIPAAKINPGFYRHVNGNTATAWGLMQGAEAANLNLFLGSYPITPATDILHELSRHKNFGVKTFQAEDEIAAICSSIGASFAGALSLTTSSGPGIALKGEAIGLAMIYETPLVIVNIQRGGPSTGLPTKTEQSDLNQALYGRNGDCPLIIIAASRPSDCFHMAFEACRLTLEHMTPVMLLTDGYIANGAEPWRLPDLKKDYSVINSKLTESALEEDGEYFPYKRDENLVRPWAVPGTPGHEHRLGGLEKEDTTGNVCYDPENHLHMSKVRAKKVALVANNIPLQELEGEESGDLLVVSWGGTYGATHMAVRALQKEGHKVSLMHLRYLNPMPKNIGDLLKNFKQILVPELNMGQMVDVLNAKFACGAVGYNKVMGLPFKISELVGTIKTMLEGRSVKNPADYSD